MDVFAIIALAVIFALLAVLFLLPGEKSSRYHSDKKSRLVAQDDTKDWKEACFKLEKHIHTLRAEIEKGKLREKNFERDLSIQKEKTKRLQEKISQERGWQEKDTADKERKGQEIIQMKESLQHAEGELQNEHGERLRLEHEVKEAKATLASAADVKRSLESQVARLQAQVDAARQEIANLRQENAKLSKQHDEATWVAKSEYVKVEQQLRAVEKEFERFRHQIRREAG